MSLIASKHKYHYQTFRLSRDFSRRGPFSCPTRAKTSAKDLSDRPQNGSTFILSVTARRYHARPLD